MQLLREEEIDIMFLTETDTSLQNAETFNVKGYTTHTQLCGEKKENVRIIALTRDDCGVEILRREDLMSGRYPSVWIELRDKYKSSTIVGGFYRQWKSDKIRSVPDQIEQMLDFCEQIDRAFSPDCKMIITGDANLCSDKWKMDNYNMKSIANPLLECLEQNGLQIQYVGKTYQADHTSADGTVASSALDHVYSSKNIEKSVSVRKLLSSSTDHLPVLISYSLDKNKVEYKRSLTKRSFKNFTKEKWNACLAKQNWSEIDKCQGVNEMVDIFDTNVALALDEVAPVKKFTVRSNHRFGLSDSTKDLMKKRDKTRNEIRKASAQERTVLMKQYKSLRNRVTSQLRKEQVEYNSKRIEEANSDRELWRVANEAINPKKETQWNLKMKDDTYVTDEYQVAGLFNEFFVEKVEHLKASINPNLVEDPLTRLKEKMKKNGHKASLDFREVSEKKMVEHLKKLKKKKSSGLDGLSQENLLLGANKLVCPLTKIINQSIREGIFPTSWKSAVVTPILKKGSPEILNNYRPVSCLPAASKVLEIVICSQLSDFLESNDLLPQNQHGFRPGRSCMTAWQEIQLDWAIKTEQKKITGVLLWDLSAAFDTLDCDGLCAKLELYGLQPRSVRWIKSFLTDRSQCVRIGNQISSPKFVPTGVPQGGVLSPLVFVLFVSDLQDWLKHSTAPTYADDTTTGTSANSLEDTLEKMEEDAGLVLKFMASNGLVANADKTSYLLLNHKKCEEAGRIKVGDNWVERTSTGKLLGINFEDNQQWKNQIRGKGGVLAALNSRLYILRRMRNHLTKRAILKLVDGIFISKVRFGVQLYGTVRTSNTDTECRDLRSIQLVQNKLLRSLNNTKLSDRVSTAYLLEKFNMLTVNQINAQAKLLEVWKALNVPKYPLKIKKQSENHEGTRTRADKKERPCEIGRSTLTRKTCVSDAIRLWNLSPDSIKESKSVYKAKTEIKRFVKTLPM